MLKLSSFLILIGILEIIFLSAIIYYLFVDNNGGNAMGATIAFLGSIIFLFVIAFEQLILYTIKIRKEIIYLIELILIIVGIIYIYFNGFSIG